MKALRRLVLWIAVNVPMGTLNASLLAFGLGAKNFEEEQVDPTTGSEMPPPTQEEIDDWADGIVYAKAPNGDDVYFDTKDRAWRKVRRLGPDSNAQWPRDND